MENGASVLVWVPSVAAITILAYLPVSGLLGVPESLPVICPKVAQTGLFWILKVIGLSPELAIVG